MAVAEVAQDRRRSEIVIWTGFVRAVRLIGPAARKIPRIAAGQLLSPSQLPCLHVECQHGVACLWGRIGVCIAGSDVNYAVLHIDGRRTPYSGARRSETIDAVLVLASQIGPLGDRIGLPDLLAGLCVERDNAATEGAASVLRIA